MHASYRQMIAEHDQIEREAQALLAELREDGSDAGSLGSQLDTLAQRVGDHIVIETAIVDDVEGAPKKGPWVETWKDGAAAFQQLRTDWLTFVGRWDVSSIEAGRSAFRAESEAMLARLSERLQQETLAFYSTALQHGALNLR